MLTVLSQGAQLLSGQAVFFLCMLLSLTDPLACLAQVRNLRRVTLLL